MMVNAAMASVGLRPRRMAWRMRSWISVGFERPWAVKEKTTPASQSRVGGARPRHQVTQRHRVQQHFDHRGIGEINRNTNSAHGNNVIESAKLVRAEHHHVQLKLLAKAWPLAFLVLGVRRPTGGRKEWGQTVASDCGGRGSTVLRAIQIWAAWWWVASINVASQRGGSHQGWGPQGPAALAVRPMPHGVEPRTVANPSSSVVASGVPVLNTFAGLDGTGVNPPGGADRFPDQEEPAVVKSNSGWTKRFQWDPAALPISVRSRPVNESWATTCPVSRERRHRWNFTARFDPRHPHHAKWWRSPPLSGSGMSVAEPAHVSGGRTGHAIGAILKLSVGVLSNRTKHTVRSRKSRLEHGKSYHQPRDGCLKGGPKESERFWPVVSAFTVFDTSRVGGDGVGQAVLDGTITRPTIVRRPQSDASWPNAV